MKSSTCCHEAASASRGTTSCAPAVATRPAAPPGKTLEKFPAKRSPPEFAGENLVTDELPMLVPPAATKTPFFRNRLLAAQWTQAAEHCEMPKNW
jgi:hypothetical protein